MRYFITVEYDGTNYHGWQIQPGYPTVQGLIEGAIFQLTGEKTTVMGSGRTDAGVHAYGQGAHFDIAKTFDPYRLCAGINSFLREEGISVVAAKVVPDDFHARFSAIKRSYVYRLLHRKFPSPLARDRMWEYPYPLDLDAIQEAIPHFIGRHDFTSFRDSECTAKSPIKTIDTLEMKKDGEVIEFSVSARSFLHHQVRNIVGTLVWVGAQKIAPAEIPGIFESKDRCQAGPTAPACGLYFVDVIYPEDATVLPTNDDDES